MLFALLARVAGLFEFQDDVAAIAARAHAAANRTAPALPLDTWRAGACESDARVLLYRSGDAISRVALVDGSMVRTEDTPPIHVQLPREVPDLYLDVSGTGRAAGARRSAASTLSSSCRPQWGHATRPVSREPNRTSRKASRHASRRPMLSLARSSREASGEAVASNIKACFAVGWARACSQTASSSKAEGVRITEAQ